MKLRKTLFFFSFGTQGDFPLEYSATGCLKENKCSKYESFNKLE